MAVQPPHLISQRMKTCVLLLAGLLFTATHSQAQEPTAADSTGLPGDNFNLQGALDLFKQAKDLEGFEKALNAENNHVNNLDLDGNGDVDYVRVTSHKEGDAIAIVMTVPVNKGESQDVAVIELEKTGNDQAAVQIRGDEDLYPENTIVEPTEQKEEMKGGKGPMTAELVTTYVSVNVWFWPCVPLCFGPHYVAWVSPWYWGYYPPWWHPWRPHPWRAWWGWGFPYHHWYRHVHTCTVVHAHAIYAPRRMSSGMVRGRYQPARERFNATRPARPQVTAPRKDKVGAHDKAPAKPQTKPARKPSRNKGTRPAAPKPSRPTPRPGRGR
jgi:hypothetical protein